jgi:hypothetical protein
MLRRVLSLGCWVAVALGFAPQAWAQGCVLCYTSAAAGGPVVQGALRSGILVLLIPVLLLLIGMVALVWRSAVTQTSTQRSISS